MDTKTIIGIAVLVVILGLLAFFRIRNQRKDGMTDESSNDERYR